MALAWENIHFWCFVQFSSSSVVGQGGDRLCVYGLCALLWSWIQVCFVMWRGNKNVGHLHIFPSCASRRKQKPHGNPNETVRRHYDREAALLPIEQTARAWLSWQRTVRPLHPIGRRWPWKSPHFYLFMPCRNWTHSVDMWRWTKTPLHVSYENRRYSTCMRLASLPLPTTSNRTQNPPANAPPITMLGGPLSPIHILFRPSSFPTAATTSPSNNITISAAQRDTITMETPSERKKNEESSQRFGLYNGAWMAESLGVRSLSYCRSLWPGKLNVKNSLGENYRHERTLNAQVVAIFSLGDRLTMHPMESKRNSIPVLCPVRVRIRCDFEWDDLMIGWQSHSTANAWIRELQ